jgi:protein phosphatase slingshot
MWSSLQTLHKASDEARRGNLFQGGSAYCWTQSYTDRISSDRSCLNEWLAMDGLTSKRPPSPDLCREPAEERKIKELIRCKLREIMTTVDLDEVTSKLIRTRLESEMHRNLIEYKSYIDEEMLKILGQMDTATQIFEYLYLGSEWNASNLEELKLKG